jgi:hypothetical protein
MCQNEALARLVSLGLKFNVPITEIMDELKDLKCPSPNLYPEDDKNLSCPDAIANVLLEYMNDHH